MRPCISKVVGLCSLPQSRRPNHQQSTTQAPPTWSRPLIVRGKRKKKRKAKPRPAFSVLWTGCRADSDVFCFAETHLPCLLSMLTAPTHAAYTILQHVSDTHLRERRATRNVFARSRGHEWEMAIARVAPQRVTGSLDQFAYVVSLPHTSPHGQHA
jgi:hypothetical protein